MSKTTRKLREHLIGRLESIGGYYGSRSHSYPIEFTVHVLPTIDHESIRDAMIENGMFQGPADFTLQYPDFESWFDREYPNVYALLDSARSMLCDDLNGNDDGINRWSPKTATRWGFEYKGEGADKTFDCEYRIYGRNGKHVCIAAFDGVKLEGTSTNDMVHILNTCNEKGGNDYENYSNVWVRKFLGMLEEWEQIFTSANAEAIAVGYMADQVYQYLEGEREHA